MKRRLRLETIGNSGMGHKSSRHYFCACRLEVCCSLQKRCAVDKAAKWDTVLYCMGTVNSDSCSSCIRRINSWGDAQYCVHTGCRIINIMNASYSTNRISTPLTGDRQEAEPSSHALRERPARRQSGSQSVTILTHHQLPLTILALLAQYSTVLVILGTKSSPPSCSPP